MVLRVRLASMVQLVLALATLRVAAAQDYLLPNGPGKDLVTGSCESCHGIETVIKHRRAPAQWDEVIAQMLQRGVSVTDDQKALILSYLKTHYGQDRDYVAQAPPVRGHGPGLALALEAATHAQAACKQKGLKSTTLVVDSLGDTVVLLVGDGMMPINGAIAAHKAAVVLKYKEASGVIMKRLNDDPELVSEIRHDPAMGEALQGGLPIIADGEFLGAIAVSGAYGPADTDEICARAGLAAVAARLH
jgi:uncharacterized protein GlcG (DUF336 family)